MQGQQDKSFVVPLQIENSISFEEQTTEVVLVEQIASGLAGGIAVSAELRGESSIDNSDKSSNDSSHDVWFISRGTTTVAIDLARTFPTNSPLMRAKALLAVSGMMKEMQGVAAWPTGELDLVGEVDNRWREYEVSGAGGAFNARVRVADAAHESRSWRQTGEGGHGQNRKRISLPMALNLDKATRDFLASKALDDQIAPVSLFLGERVGLTIAGIGGELECSCVDGVCSITKRGEVMSDERDIGSDETVQVDVKLGALSLTLSQLARLRKGLTLALTSEHLGGDGSFPCALTIGNASVARGEVRFVSDKVVLTVLEVA